MRKAAERTAEAASWTARSAARAAYAAEDQRKLQEVHLQLQRKESQRQAVDALLTFAQTIDATIHGAGKRKDDHMLVAAKFAHFLRDYGSDGWEELDSVAPHEVEVAYKRLRQSICPYLLSLWKKRGEFSSSLIPLLQTIARSLLYTDLATVRSLRSEIDQEQRKIRIMIAEGRQSLENLSEKAKSEKLKMETIRERYRTGLGYSACSLAGFLVFFLICILPFLGSRWNKPEFDILTGCVVSGLLLSGGVMSGFIVARVRFDPSRFHTALDRIAREERTIEDRIAASQVELDGVAEKILAQCVDPRLDEILTPAVPTPQTRSSRPRAMEVESELADIGPKLEQADEETPKSNPHQKRALVLVKLLSGDPNTATKRRILTDSLFTKLELLLAALFYIDRPEVKQLRNLLAKLQGLRPDAAPSVVNRVWKEAKLVLRRLLAWVSTNSTQAR
jgi:hypothetical protein